ncbi:MAG: hypothetical protein QOE36_342 [Gaiellaceae bacterium]|jgi:hypothetical protein|nr:hypothetical protein [Gaiellaceae bacterium]
MWFGGPELLILVLLWVLVPVVIASRITAGNGRGGAIGFVLGLALGWVGVAVAALLGELGGARARPTMYRECPSCKEQMRRDASVCPHCHRESSPWSLHEGVWGHQSASGQWYRLDERAGEWVEWTAPAS